MSGAVTVHAMIVDPRPFFGDAIRACLAKGGHVMLSQARDFDEAMRQADTLHSN
jgi:hypothetical protein